MIIVRHIWTYILMLVMMLCVSLQTCVCQLGITHSLLVPFWVTLFICSFVLISKHRWISWVIVFLYSIWCITLDIYFRANDLMLDVYSITMAENMHGFWLSVWTYVNWTTWIQLLIPILYAVCIKIIPDQPTRLWKEWGIVVGSCLICWLWLTIDSFPSKEYQTYKNNIAFYIDNGNSDTAYGQDHLFGKYGEKWFIPFHQPYYAATVRVDNYLYDYFKQCGALQYFPAVVAYYLGDQPKENMNITEAELAPYWNANAKPSSPRYNVVMLLIESMESWPLEIDPYSSDVAPYLYQWKNANHVTYVPHVYSQVRHGVSADGQMLLNTGLLPIANGATCWLYADNTFPNVASVYPYSALVDACPYNAWNQQQMTSAYGYQSYLCPTDDRYWSDREVMEHLMHVIDTMPTPFCVQAITMDMHTPFISGADFQIDMPQGIPKYMHDYLGCYHTLDTDLAWLLDTIGCVVNMDSTVIVITADHSIFKSNLLESFNTYAQKANLSIPTKRSYCPLFIYIPHSLNQTIEGQYYQMDIYPTILSAIGINSHPWKGLGINLLDSMQRNLRDTIDEAYLFQLSNKIIVNNSLTKNQ